MTGDVPTGGGTTGAPSSGGFFSSMGDNISDAFSSASSNVGNFLEGRTEVNPSDEIKHGLMYGEDDDKGLYGDWATGEEGSLSGYTAEIDPSTGDTKYFKDIKADPEEISKGLAKAAEKFKSSDGGGPIAQGSMPGMPSMPRGSVSYTPVGDSYSAMTAEQYAGITKGQIAKLLSGAIRPRTIGPLV
tara:strand:+ start:8253 stop:8813 length:561 start_codon:yes stop_codon:yes gene_type:complete